MFLRQLLSPLVEACLGIGNGPTGVLDEASGVWKVGVPELA